MNPQPKKRHSIGDWAFYLVLALCIAALGTAGYYFFASETPLNTEQTAVNVQDVMHSLTTAATTAASAKTTTAATTARGTTTAATTAVTAAQEKLSLIITRPVSGEVLTEYSGDELVYDPTMGDWRTHNGVDFACADGEEVHAVADGTVLDVYADDYYGVSVLIEHAGGLQSVYTGLSEASASLKGTKVARGAVLGRAGTTALFESALEPHVHLEMLQDGVRIDPMSVIRG